MVVSMDLCDPKSKLPYNDSENVHIHFEQQLWNSLWDTCKVHLLLCVNLTENSDCPTNFDRNLTWIEFNKSCEMVYWIDGQVQF